jgi:flagellar hook-length control protein FliK
VDIQHLVKTSVESTPNIPNRLSADSLVHPLKAGQQLDVEVVKILAENRLLVQAFKDKNAQQFDVNVSQISQRYKPGDKLTMDIVNLKPLTIQLKIDQSLAREQIIMERIRQLLPQQLDKPDLNRAIKALQSQQLPESVQREVHQLLQHVIDKSALTQSNALKDALASSGIFTEKQLISQPAVIKQDFKANVLRVIAALETIISQADPKNSVNAKAMMNTLPSLVTTALASNGNNPSQLLNVLLSGQSNSPLGTSSSQSAVPPVITSQQQALSLTQVLTKTGSMAEQLATVSGRFTPVELSELKNIFRELEGVHNKIQFNQLSMLKEPESSTSIASWLFDVPIKNKQDIDLLQLQIDQYKEKSEDEQENDIWNVQLRLDTHNLGPVQATVTLSEPDVKVVLRAQRQQSAELLTDNLELLHEALSKLGVSISHVSCSCGDVAESVLTEQYLTKTNTLVDMLV